MLNRAVAKFVAPEDLIVPYEAADISSAERITHSISMSANEIKKQQSIARIAVIYYKLSAYVFEGKTDDGTDFDLLNLPRSRASITSSADLDPKFLILRNRTVTERD